MDLPPQAFCGLGRPSHVQLVDQIPRSARRGSGLHRRKYSTPLAHRFPNRPEIRLLLRREQPNVRPRGSDHATDALHDETDWGSTVGPQSGRKSSETVGTAQTSRDLPRWGSRVRIPSSAPEKGPPTCGFFSAGVRHHAGLPTICPWPMTGVQPARYGTPIDATAGQGLLGAPRLPGVDRTRLRHHLRVQGANDSQMD